MGIVYNSHILKARELKKDNKELIYLDQLSNKANPKTHYFKLSPFVKTASEQFVIPTAYAACRNAFLAL